MKSVCFDQNDEFRILRSEMVGEQIEKRGICDSSVLEVMRSTPRHLFVPESKIWEAYQDSPLPIGDDQTISQPYMVALMTESLQLLPQHKVLEIGTGSGYQTAVLAQLAKEVYTVEINQKFFDNAKKRFNRFGFENIKMKCGDGWDGWEAEAPFDRIVVTAAPEIIPEALMTQLKEEGRLVIPFGVKQDQNLYVILKKQGKLSKQIISKVSFVPLQKGTGIR